MASYKVIDGILYQSVDTKEIQAKLDNLVAEVKPYKTGIDECNAQIKAYEQQISLMVTNSGIDKEMAKIIDPEKSSFLGF